VAEEGREEKEEREKEKREEAGEVSGMLAWWCGEMMVRAGM